MKPNVENYSWGPEESQAATLPLPFLSVFFVSERLLHVLPVIQCPSFAHELRLLRASQGPATGLYGSSTHRKLTASGSVSQLQALCEKI